MASSKTPITRDQEITLEIKFLDNCDPEDGSAIFKKGKVYELPASSANHWLRRNKAVKYVAPPPEPKPVKPPAPKRTYTRRTTTAKKPAAPKATATPKDTVVIPEEKKTPAGDLPEAESTTDS